MPGETQTRFTQLCSRLMVLSLVIGIGLVIAIIHYEWNISAYSAFAACLSVSTLLFFIRRGKMNDLSKKP